MNHQSHQYCVVLNCKNTGRNSNCKFYRFPCASWKLEQRRQWIAFVGRLNPDGSRWIPHPSSTICSAHFIGGKKADEACSPSYVPTLYPLETKSRRTYKYASKWRLADTLTATGTKRKRYTCSYNNNNPIGITNNPYDFGNNEDPLRVSKSEMPEDMPLYNVLPEDPLQVSNPEMPEDVPMITVLPNLQVVPIESFIPKDERADETITDCNDCAAFIDRFPFWCVQCGRGPLCASCAERAPHDSHFLLRTPRGAPRSHTEAVLSVIRKQLQSENLLALNDSAVKVEIKEEPKEPPSSQPEPSDPEPDPLDPLPNYRYPHTSEQVGKHEVKEHLEKRRLLQVDEHDVKKYLEKRRLLLPNSIRKLQRTALSSTVLKDTTGLKTVLNPKTSGLKLTPKRSQNHFDENETVRDYLAKSTLLKSGNDQPKYLVKLQPKGKSSQTILKDSSDLRTVLNPAPDVLKKTQRVLKATSSKIVLKVIPNDPRETQATNDVKEPIIKSFLKSPGYIKKLKNQPGKQIKSTLLKIPISELTRSGLKTLRNVKPSELLKLESVQKILKMTESRKSEPKEQKLHDLNGVSTPRLGLGAAAALDEKKTEIKIVEL
ncbi:uncharacterized protein LOC125237392 isoform X3 [Leguminivora glycinivorella]|uniref:uncharacterized protein LOC125237392 isoform X3 n=1 Tax=Leguminivora glycinivorella TaxID=1035111 RepID=UPI00200D4DA3|nr:uncharacterized protein LOC125237392 isoform X3 [Leguminivora glycinivorella]